MARFPARNPETNELHLKIGRAAKGNLHSNHPFSGAILVSGRVRCFLKGLLRDHGDYNPLGFISCEGVSIGGVPVDSHELWR